LIRGLVLSAFPEHPAPPLPPPAPGSAFNKSRQRPYIATFTSIHYTNARINRARNRWRTNALHDLAHGVASCSRALRRPTDTGSRTDHPLPAFSAAAIRACPHCHGQRQSNTRPRLRHPNCQPHRATPGRFCTGTRPSAGLSSTAAIATGTAMAFPTGTSTSSRTRPVASWVRRSFSIRRTAHRARRLVRFARQPRSPVDHGCLQQIPIGTTRRHRHSRISFHGNVPLANGGLPGGGKECAASVGSPPRAL